MIVAVFDSGVDYTHEVFGATPAIPLEEAAGMSGGLLSEFIGCAIEGSLSAADLEAFVTNAEGARSNPPLGEFLLRGIDFAGHHPDCDLAASGMSSSNIFDYNGHGTASAGMLVKRGHTVLPIKVGYSLAPEISLQALVRGCEWLINRRLSGLECQAALWPFGVAGDDAEPIYAQLAAELRAVDIDIYASGHGVHENLIEDGGMQMPCDLDDVVGVDERLTLRRHSLMIGSLRFGAWHLPGTPAFAGAKTAAIVCRDEASAYHGEERVLRVFSEEEIPRFRSSIEAHRNGVTVITSSRWSYTANPVPYTFGGTVFVTQERMADLGLEEVCKEGASVDVNVDIGTDWTKEAASRSRGRTCLGQTGGTFPAAHTRSRWSGAFGPSFAACAGLCDNHGRALGDGQVSTTESVFALNGKNVLLTGAAGGVGREAARAFTLVGARVLGADRNELGLQTMLGAGSLADMVAGDLTEAQVLDEILARWPDVDVLINNVGDGITAKLEDSTDELIEKMLAVNFRVTAGLCRRYIPGMAERRQGKVVNVSSILAMHPVPTVAAYSASKASLIAFTRSIALEYAHCGIQANVIAPGYLSGARQAEFFRSEHGEQFIRRFMPTGAPGKAGILNGPLLFLSSWMSDHITGHVLIVDGGYSIW